MGRGKIFCPSDTLIQTHRRDLFFIPPQRLSCIKSFASVEGEATQQPENLSIIGPAEPKLYIFNTELKLF